jgi:hypothetical protein
MLECATIKSLNPLITSSDRIKAEVMDRSEAKATLRVSAPLHVGTTVQIRFRDHLVLGDVQTCKPSNGGFEVTVHFQDVMPVSEG